ncbi:MAG: acyl-CoA thioesterase [Bacteroidales bacterium]|nr:acyl-CoA thioesterase [Bacteroidales bacterium]MBQ2499598.1 acyl-CoA thioesterase [Bacteroidales bacterium]MCR5035719.1 acyl-CoA thioesterase [Bacteroidales bacterium]
MGKEKVLSVTKPFDIRFSEVDSMGVVWHGHYAMYFEDAREEFGKKYHLEYLFMYDQGFFEPLVELTFKYKKPLIYGMKPEITITYLPTEAAKIVFDYEIRDTATGEVYVTGHSVQVFMDKTNYQMVLYSPDFYEEWKKKWEVNV